MERCREEMLEIEQPEELYGVGRALREAFEPYVDDDLPPPARALLTRLHVRARQEVAAS